MKDFLHSVACPSIWLDALYLPCYLIFHLARGKGIFFINFNVVLTPSMSIALDLRMLQTWSQLFHFINRPKPSIVWALEIEYSMSMKLSTPYYQVGIVIGKEKRQPRDPCMKHNTLMHNNLESLHDCLYYYRFHWKVWRNEKTSLNYLRM